MLYYTKLSPEMKRDILWACARLIAEKEPRHVNMNSWACGTQACLAGWIARDKHLSEVFGIELGGLHDREVYHTNWVHPATGTSAATPADIIDDKFLSSALFSWAKPYEEHRFNQDHKMIALDRLATVDLLEEKRGSPTADNFVLFSEERNQRIQRIQEMIEGAKIHITSVS